MKKNIETVLLCAFFLSTAACAGQLSDSLPITGRFYQNGQWVSRFKLERFLLSRDSCADLADRSLGYKWSGHAIGALLWCVDAGIAVYEIKGVLDAIKNESILDTNGMRQPYSNTLYKYSIPLTIGTEVASFIQQRLYARSDYLLHKSALAFNETVQRKLSPGAPLDLRIVKSGFGGYTQGGLGFGEPVLDGVLFEQPASAARAALSWVFKETGVQLGSWGGMYIGLALLSYLEEMAGDSTLAIDKKARTSNLTIGVSLAVGGIVSAIVSSVLRTKGIEKYNEAVAARMVPAVGAPSAAAPRDSSGIREDMKKPPTDTASTAR
jgi:hypothetical protein